MICGVAVGGMSGAASGAGKDNGESVMTNASLSDASLADDPDVYRTGETLGPEPVESEAMLASALQSGTDEVATPPSPDEFEFDEP